MSWRGTVRALARALFDALAPERCVACEALAPDGDFCGECGDPEPLRDVLTHVHGVPVFAGARYAEPLVAAVHRFKYGRAPELAGALAKLAVPGIDLLGIEPGAVWVPVPLHPRRLAERGYNQSALLARELARAAGGRVDARRLQRLRHTEQQAKRDRNSRAENVAQAFAARPARRAASTVVLVDDVVTSGSTLAACIDALHAAGACVVGCLAVASATGVGEEFVAVRAANAGIIDRSGPWSPDWSTPRKMFDSTGSRPTGRACRGVSKSSAPR